MKSLRKFFSIGAIIFFASSLLFNTSVEAAKHNKHKKKQAVQCLKYKRVKKCTQLKSGKKNVQNKKSV